MRSVVAVVVTYNRKELLQECLTSLLGQTIKCDIIVIDNNSMDGTSDMIKSCYSDTRIKYFNTGANMGGAGGFNVGIKRAIEEKYRYIWLMDDDTVPEPKALEMLLKADRILGGNWGCLGSLVKWTDGSICEANRQKKTLSSFVPDNEMKKKKIIRITMNSFVSLLVKAEIIKEVGLPKKEYIIWTDDYDFTGRISRKYPIYMVSKSIVVHKMGKNQKANFAIETIDRLNRYKYLYRNDVDCYRQFGIKGWIYILLKDCYAVLNVLLYSNNVKRKKIDIIVRSFIEGLFFRPAIEIVKDQK